MAFNWQTFRTRALTALVFVAVMLTGLLWNAWSFLALFSVIHFGCWWEFFNLLEKIHSVSFHRYTRFGFMLLGFALLLWFCQPLPYSINEYSLKNNLSFPVSLAGFVLLVLGIFQKDRFTLKAFGAAALGLVYISLSWGLMMDLYCTEFIIRNEDIIKQHISLKDFYEFNRYDSMGLFFPVTIIACMWINDTMAYITGSLIGRTPLSKISPKKTWEGTIGGIILCTGLVGWLIGLYLLPDNTVIRYYHWFIIAAIAAITGTVGDLFESWLKRRAGVKDSGSFMPGHGGFLDRFDSLLFATPFVWLFLQLIA
jgi:phosphatidate cytidylyltransferase